MPETPNSFEEIRAEVAKHGTIWQDEEGYWYVDAPKLGEGETEAVAVGMAALVLWPKTGFPSVPSPPQAAAVPARQDAVPDVTEEKLCEGDAKMFTAIGLGAQTAVGEGELPEIVVTTEDMKETYGHHGQLGYSSVHAELRATRRKVIELHGQLREAIAQRDEWAGIAGSNAAGEILQRERAEAAEAQRDEAREMHAIEKDWRIAAETVIRRLKLAAIDVPKPGEIERLKAELWFEKPQNAYEVAFNRALEEITDRLRSLPSEPSLGNQEKAAENGD